MGEPAASSAANAVLDANAVDAVANDDPAAAALLHGNFGRSIVRHIPGLPTVEGSGVETVTVVGAGLMGSGIAIALLNAGIRVSIVDPKDSQRDQARNSIGRTILRDVEKGRIAQADADDRLGRLTFAATLEEAAGSDLFIEAIFEDLGAKKAVFEQLDRLARPGAILASNTSTLDIDAIAAFTRRPEDVVGLHFFSPANVMRLLEIVQGARTSSRVLARALAFAGQIGKTGVVAGVCDGFIGNRIFEEYLRQAWFLLEEGVFPQQLDRVLEEFGMAMGPCRTMDLAGQDIGWKIRQRRAVEQPDRPYSKIPDLICEMGRYGQKTGAGFYLYPDGRTPQVDPEVEAIILAESARVGVERRTIEDREILERCLFAMANEGAKILEERIAYRPVDIDVVYLDGYGFPAERGGPMYHADRCGLDSVLASMERYGAGYQGWAWEPAPLLRKLAENGGRFADLNRS